MSYDTAIVLPAVFPVMTPVSIIARSFVVSARVSIGDRRMAETTTVALMEGQAS
jgi:hypothetical protein